MAAGTHIPGRNVYQPNESHYFQARCFLSRCSSATCVHTLSKSVGHVVVDLAGTWRVRTFLSFPIWNLWVTSPIHFFSTDRLELLWLTMTQFCTHCELEFLPVYVPSEEEKRNPRLFASNVRDVMAKWVFGYISNATYYLLTTFLLWLLVSFLGR